MSNRQTPQGKREQLFQHLLTQLIDSANHIHRYESKPRQYGTEDVLFMVECHTLEAIGDNPSITNTELANLMGKSKSAISQTINKLIKKQLLIKVPHPDNNLNQLFELTQRGTIVYNYHREFDVQNYRAIQNILDGFSDEELAVHIKVQASINQILKANAE